MSRAEPVGSPGGLPAVPAGVQREETAVPEGVPPGSCPIRDPIRMIATVSILANRSSHIPAQAGTHLGALITPASDRRLPETMGSPLLGILSSVAPAGVIPSASASASAPDPRKTAGSSSAVQSSGSSIQKRTGQHQISIDHRREYVADGGKGVVFFHVVWITADNCPADEGKGARGVAAAGAPTNVPSLTPFDFLKSVPSKTSDGTYEAWRRFSEFHTLRKDIIASMRVSGRPLALTVVENVPFPKKTKFAIKGGKKSDVVDMRQSMLEHWLQRLLQPCVALGGEAPVPPKIHGDQASQLFYRFLATQEDVAIFSEPELSSRALAPEPSASRATEGANRQHACSLERAGAGEILPLLTQEDHGLVSSVSTESCLDGSFEDQRAHPEHVLRMHPHDWAHTILRWPTSVLTAVSVACICACSVTCSERMQARRSVGRYIG